MAEKDAAARHIGTENAEVQSGSSEEEEEGGLFPFHSTRTPPLLPVEVLVGHGYKWSSCEQERCQSCLKATFQPRDEVCASHVLLQR